MIPVIADPRLQELYATASNEMMLTQGIVSTAAQAFITALNERLEAAERTVHKLENIKRYEVIDANGIYPTEFVHRRAGRFLMWKDVNELLSAYRQFKEQP